MLLQPGGRTARGRGFFHRAPDDFGFGFAEGDQFDPAGFENRSDAHRQGALRDLGKVAEEDRVVAAGDLIEVDPAGATVGGRGRFIKADVPRATNPENLQVNNAGVADRNGALRICAHPLAVADDNPHSHGQWRMVSNLVGSNLR
jgi:hypothetical protein